MSLGETIGATEMITMMMIMEVAGIGDHRLPVRHGIVEEVGEEDGVRAGIATTIIVAGKGESGTTPITGGLTPIQTVGETEPFRLRSARENVAPTTIRHTIISHNFRLTTSKLGSGF